MRAEHAPSAHGWLDRSIERWFPAWGARRLLARVSIHAARSYEGASMSRRAAGGSWNQLQGSAITDVGWALYRLRGRSRHLVANNGHARRGLAANTERTLGPGVVPTAIDKASTVRKRVADLWQAYMVDSAAIDPDGRSNVYSLQAAAFRAAQESGDALLVRRIVPATPENPLGLQILLLEGDQLDESRNEGFYLGRSSGSGVVVQGVEFDRLSRRTRYWILPEHPGHAGGLSGDHPVLGPFQDQIVTGARGAGESVPVPADDVIHVGRRDRPGQVRYVPWLAPCLIRLHDLGEFFDARLIREKIAACFAGFVYQDSSAGSTNAWGSLPVNPSSTPGEAPEENLLRLKPGALPRLKWGERIEFADPPEVSGWEEVTRTELRYVAIALGCTYAELTGDYGQANYSSQRAAEIDRQREVVGWRRDITTPLLCWRLWRWFCDAIVLQGLAGRACRAAWTYPRREMSDPEKEVRALVAQVRAGFCTWSEAVRMSGYDPEEVLEQLALEADRMDERDLHLTTDPRAEGFQDGENDPSRMRAARPEE